MFLRLNTDRTLKSLIIGCRHTFNGWKTLKTAFLITWLKGVSLENLSFKLWTHKDSDQPAHLLGIIAATCIHSLNGL